MRRREASGLCRRGHRANIALTLGDGYEISGTLELADKSEPETDIRPVKIQLFKDDNEVYLVDPSLWHDLSGELVPKVLRVTVSRQGVVRLWPIRLPDEEGKLDDWNRSALEAAEIGKTNWIRLRANRSLGAYEVFEAHGEIPDPEWPAPVQQIVEIAFKGKFITSWDHPALRRLRGEG